MNRLHHCLATLLVSTAALGVAVPGYAQEWTRFRGPNGSGVSAANLPVTVTEADYNWKVKLPGVGHSSPVLWGDRIFVTGAEDAAGKRHLVCLQASDGKQLWARSFDYTKYNIHRFNSSASSTPAVDKDHVYVVWPAPGNVTVLAYTHKGDEVWKRDLGAYPAQHGGASSPIVVNDTVIFAREPENAAGAIVALDCKTGEVRWKRDRFSKDAPYSTPVVYQPKGGPAELIFTNNSIGMTSLDPKTGELNWETKSLFVPRCVGSPQILPNGCILATAGNGGGDKQAFAVRPGSRATKTEPKVEYQLTRGLSYVPTPIVVGDRLYLWGDGGIVTCFNASNGEMVWSERVGGNYFGSPVCANGKIYAMSANGELVVVEAGDQFKLLGKSNLGEASHSTPAIARGAMFLRTEGHLISIGGKKP